MAKKMITLELTKPQSSLTVKALLWERRRRYLRQKRSGCCGFRDFTRDGPDGQLYMLGYNYGH